MSLFNPLLNTLEIFMYNVKCKWLISSTSYNIFIAHLKTYIYLSCVLIGLVSRIASDNLICTNPNDIRIKSTNGVWNFF